MSVINFVRRSKTLNKGFVSLSLIFIGFFIATLLGCGEVPEPTIVNPAVFATPANTNSDARYTPVLTPKLSTTASAISGNPATGQTSNPSLASQTSGQGRTTPWTSEWLRDQPCTLPCWQGITPGKTTVAEVENLVAHNIHMSLGKVSKGGAGLGNILEINGEGVHIFAIYNSSDEPFIFPTNVIYRIFFEFQEPIRLDVILAKFGPPDVVETQQWPPPVHQYHFSAYFIKFGLNLLGEWQQPPRIDADLPLTTLELYPATNVGKRMAMTSNDPSKLVPWAGYKDFAYYCAESPQPCA